MTIAIASYQRREPLIRLLRALDRQLAASEVLRRDLEVVVVLDGSTDGSRHAVEAEKLSVPVSVRWQPNRGLASARNLGLAAACGGVVWFLDDDLVPSPALVAQHREAHASGPASVVMGPCRIPPDVKAPSPLLRWWDAFYAELEETGRVDRFDRFTTANASGPAKVFSSVGGFDESFVRYGLEDYELAVRLLGAGVPVRFASEAVAWHPDVPPTSVLVGRQRSLGFNAALMAQLHPETVDVLFPATAFVNPYPRVLRRLRLRSPRPLMAVSHVAFAASRLAGPLHAGIARRAELLARVAANTAGVAEADPGGALLARALGQMSGAVGGGPDRLDTGPKSHQPTTTPTSSDTTISR